MAYVTERLNLEVAQVKRTTYAAVSQFEGITTDCRPLYVRLRHGQLTVHVGPVGGSIEAAIREQPIYAGEFGDDHDFDISWPEIEQVTGLRCIGDVKDYMQQ